MGLELGDPVTRVVQVALGWLNWAVGWLNGPVIQTPGAGDPGARWLGGYGDWVTLVMVARVPKPWWLVGLVTGGYGDPRTG